MERTKLVFVLLNYSRRTDRHYYHLYSFLNKLGEKIPVRLLIEAADGEPEFNTITDVRCCPVGNSRRIWVMREILQAYREGFRIFYCHYTFGAALFASTLTRLLGGETYLWHCIMIDVLLHEHNVSQKSRGSLMFRGGLKILHHLVTGSDFMKNYYHQKFGMPRKRIRIIPNYIQHQRFERKSDSRIKARELLSLPQEQFVILFVHGLEKGKGGNQLVPIAQKLKADKSSITLVVVGDGTEFHEIQQQIKEKELESLFRLEGPVANEKIVPYYHAADLFIMPSLYEEFSRTLLEAMASETPFVASDGRGGTYAYTSELQHKFIVPAGDSTAFANKIREMLQDQNLRKTMAQEGKKHVMQFSEENVLALFMKTVGSSRE